MSESTPIPEPEGIDALGELQARLLERQTFALDAALRAAGVACFEAIAPYFTSRGDPTVIMFDPPADAAAALREYIGRLAIPDMTESGGVLYINRPRGFEPIPPKFLLTAMLRVAVAVHLAAVYPQDGRPRPAAAVATPAALPEIPAVVEADDVVELYRHPDLGRLIDAVIDRVLWQVTEVLGVKEYDVCEGSDDFWGDVDGSIGNIFADDTGSMPVLREVAAERDRQDAAKGGPANDDRLLTREWCGRIAQNVNRIHQLAVPGHRFPAEARVRLIRTAALAVAAVQAIDRREAEAEAQPG